jgi:hypothetical protein
MVEDCPEVHRERTLAVGRINLEEVMNEPDKNKEWIDEPLILGKSARYYANDF